MKKLTGVFLLMSVVMPTIAEEQPSMEFLQFLGEWEDEQGRWVDPLDSDLQAESETGQEINGKDDE